MKAKEEISAPNIQSKQHTVEKLKKAMDEDKLNHIEKAYKLYMEALEDAGVYLFYEKDPEIKENWQQFTSHYNKAIFIRKGQCVEESYLSHKAEVGLGLLESSLKLSDSDVGGLDACKKLLEEAAIVPIEFPHFFTGNRKPWRAILLYGPPGTGKTHVANAIATDSHSTFFSVSASNIVSKWMGEGEKQVSNLFRSARDEAPSIIFIDEIDSLCGPRGNDNEHEASRRIKTEFLVHMQAVSNDVTNVLVLAATNTPNHLDEAMRRRFEKRIYVPLPTPEAREQIFKWHIGKTPHNLSPEDFRDLASKTDGFSGSDISICVKDALYQPIRATLDAKFFRENSEGMWVPCKNTDPGAKEYTLEKLKAKVGASQIQPPPNTKADFDNVLKKQKPTVSEADIEECEKFNKQFGNDG
ncbi:hypothetical protein CMV_026314 [Castanea mollissima]|uniref:AAA+ ATPase domain-containing protein n=1 Tax=Castanea mollissima TaxID=60419 RepID=A0A8J4QC10_9ROSI|nr:hypothetical protein CMV_026314 [Castanea mollissima]